MATKINIKNNSLSESKKNSKAAAQFDPAWLNSEIDVTQSNRRLRLLKRMGSRKESSRCESPLGWLMNWDVDSETLHQINAWHRSLMRHEKTKRVAKEVFEAIRSLPEMPDASGEAITVLAACHAVRAIAGKCEIEDWKSLVARLMEISNTAETNTDLAPAVYQQLAIEVPLTIAFQIPEIDDYRQLADRKCREMAISVSEKLDHDGWPDAKYLPAFGPLVASWVRCSVLNSELELEPCHEAASQLEWLVRQLLRMLRPDRTLAFSQPDSAPATDSFLKCLLEWSNDTDDKRLLKCLKTRNRRVTSTADTMEIETSNISEWSESALLYSRWEPGSPKVAVDFSANRIRTEVCRHTNLICGDSTPEISINGVALDAKAPFEVACIQSGDDVDYLELEQELGSGVKLTRQYLLSRDEEFLMIADMVVPESVALISYRASWPLARGVEGMHESETREIYLTESKKIQSLILPLALPEWKVGRTDDKLDFQNGSMCLTQSSQGRGLYAPLFFDLSPQRSRKKRTWRQLTVAENLSRIRRDEGCAFRVQLDQQQWIFYRAVASTGVRTYLGENVNCEFVFNRFFKNGTVEDLIEVE